MSGRSSRSTLMFTKSSFITRAMPSSSKDSCAITWHQWQAEYPTERRIGLPVFFDSASASGPHGYQSTGFSACCWRYGLVSKARRLGIRECCGRNSWETPMIADATPMTADHTRKGVESGRERQSLRRATPVISLSFIGDHRRVHRRSSAFPALTRRTATEHRDQPEDEGAAGEDDGAAGEA